MPQAKQRPPSNAANRKPRPQQAPAATPPPQPKPAPTAPAARQTAAERRAQRAAEAQQARRQRQRRNLLIGLVVAAALAVAAFFYLREQMAVQALGTPIPDEGRGHVNESEPLTFKHIPPSSGTHYPTAQPPGIYRTQEISEGNWLHSLEHGNVVALVNCTTDCNAVFDQLQGIFERDLPQGRFGGVKFLAVRYNKPFTDGNTSPVTLVAWGNELQLQGVDKETIVRFYRKFVDKGPELVP